MMGKARSTGVKIFFEEFFLAWLTVGLATRKRGLPLRYMLESDKLHGKARSGMSSLLAISK
jgi:hypothetical protein